MSFLLLLDTFSLPLNGHMAKWIAFLCFCSSYSSNPSSPMSYDLFGISNHSGTLHGGHYTAYCRHPKQKEKWHLYNDRAVSGASKSGVISYEAYLLFFEQKEVVPPVSPPLAGDTSLQNGNGNIIASCKSTRSCSPSFTDLPIAWFTCPLNPKGPSSTGPLSPSRPMAKVSFKPGRRA